MSSVNTRVSPSAYERWELPNVGPETGDKRPIPTTPLTAARIEAMQNQAYTEAAEEGRSAGYALGYEEGVRKATAESTEVIERLNEIVKHLERPLLAVDDDIEHTLSVVISLIARQLIKRELATEPREIQAVVHECLSVVPLANQDVRIVLHPSDAVTIRDHAQPKWQIVEDPQITPGGCRLEQGECLVDATVERRLEEVISHVLAPTDGAL